MSVKTVKCPECEAEQAIVRDEDNTMKCAFCGAEISLPDFEEGESIDYSYDEEKEPEKIEPQGEKIEAVFVLNEEEVGNAFAVSGKIKERKYIIYIELALLFFFGTAILIMNILGFMGRAGIEKPTTTNWLYVALCYGMLPVVGMLPKRTKRKIIRNATSGNQLEISIYENLFEVHIEGRDPKDDWQQPYDGSFGLIHDKGLFVVTLQSGQILAIPERSLTAEEIPVVKERLLTKLEEC
ncbi:MAG: hypothetical protein IKM39_04625 [Clostridia bacterium]|nr:hypothetical protein [Clostridia bacterium]